MRKFACATAVALVIAVAPFTKAVAQTNSYRTNVLINLTFNLTYYEQVVLAFTTNGPFVPSARTVTVPTAGIISAVARNANITGDLSTAKLYWRTSWTDYATNATHDVIIRRGTNDTVVNSYCQVSFPDRVSTVRATLTGTTNVSDYANCVISLGTSQGSFTVHGVAVLKSASMLYNNRVVEPLPMPTSFTATIAGSGSIGFHRAEWKGTITGSGQKVEIVPISP
jgi:hypothetical protein